MKENAKAEKKSSVTARQWVIFLLVGLIGQFAWAIENMYLNTYLYYLNYTDPSGQGFNYSLMIALTTAFSAIVATVTTLIMGSLTDKLKKRKIFITVGYIVWGVATASFGLLNGNNANALLPISMTAVTSAIMVIVIDCIMTFFGSTANDAAFNAYVTANTKDKDRGKVEGVLSILPLIAMLIIFVGLNGLTTEAQGYRWDLFFYIVGALVSVVGVISIWLIPKEKKEEKTQEKYGKLLIEGFKPSVIKQNKELYILLIIYFIYGVAIQTFFPYLMVYVERTCNISNSGESFLTAFAIVMACALLLGSLGSVIIGRLSDRFSKMSMIIPVFVILIVGCLMMFFAPSIASDTGRTAYTAIAGTVMILGYVSVPTVLNAMVREHIPHGKEGSFLGIRNLFVVALPMCIGPFIGDALNQAYGEHYLNEYNVDSLVPSEWGYIVASCILLLAFIPIVYLMVKGKKKDKDKNGAYLFKELTKDLDIEPVYRLEGHPRPSFSRKGYVDLGGEFDYLITKDASLPLGYEGKVLVPYAIESPYSKVNRALEKDEYLFYHKRIDLGEDASKEHVFLNFEGVDQEATVYIDGTEIGSHLGGYTRFSFDIKPYIHGPVFDLIVRVRDVTDCSYHLTGKQRMTPTGWFYSSSSGIWKPVYIEAVGEKYVKSLKMTPDYEGKAVKVHVETSCPSACRLYIDGECHQIETGKEEVVSLKNDFRPWSPETPNLYDVKVEFGDDTVYSSFGFKKVEVKEGEDGYHHFYLNDKKIFINGLLDQGYYFLGGLTPVSYENLEHDVVRVKELGYNTIRMHVKVECEPFYYYCDKYGILVIQDIPNGGERTRLIDVVKPRVSIRINNQKMLNYKNYGRLNEEGREEFRREADEIVDYVTPFVSVFMITIFNEAWGQFDSDENYELLKSKHPGFLYDTASGWLDTDGSDVFSIHSYTVPTKKRDERNSRPYVLTEIGGASLEVKDHFIYPKVFGHGKCKKPEQLEKKYRKLYSKLTDQMEEGRLQGVIYTQLSDCEGEANGIFTLDRECLKMDRLVITSINERINSLCE